MTLPLLFVLLLGAAPASEPPSCKGADAAFENARKGESLSGEALAPLSAECLRMLRNVPYARHGRKFADPSLAAFFAKKSWYRLNPAFAEGSLSDVDRANVEQVRAREQDIALRAALEAGNLMV